MTNKLDSQYIALLEDILDNGTWKSDRTGTGTISTFGQIIKHDMRLGFPLLTTKKMAWKQIVTELLWFLRGETNIQSLVKQGNYIWVGDAYKKYVNWYKEKNYSESPLSRSNFIEKIKTDDKFAEAWGDLGPIYGKQWRDWQGIDQISQVITSLKTNPNSRRIMVNAWKVDEIEKMTLPPCHYGFQFWTRELKPSERAYYYNNQSKQPIPHDQIEQEMDEAGVPKLGLSLTWTQRSVDTFLGLPFNIASYGILLELLAKIVNMVPLQLIGFLGDTHIYSNHIDQVNLQISREQQAYQLPKLKILKDQEFFKSSSNIDQLLENLNYTDFQLENYQSQPSIIAPLSN